ncbi:response regulator, partial [Vibrio mimicus]
TAASDMETVREAVRCGVFDYLLKPIAYDRVQNSLERYLKYISSLRANDSVNQRHVDELFNFQAKTEQLDGLPKGIDELTLIKIQEIYHHEPKAAYTAELLGQAIGISKTTARRYLEYCDLEYCVSSGFLEACIQHGRVGRPERLYQKR